MATNHIVDQKHILIVDDDLDLLQTQKELLEAKDFIVSTATNGVEALKIVMHLDVDAILCDLMMPQMAGDMFFKAVERVKPHLCKRFIFITGYEKHPAYADFLSNLKPIVLFKPVTLGKLLGTINLLFKKLENQNSNRNLNR